MKSETKSEVIGRLDAGAGEAQLEVVLCEREGESMVALQLSTWHEALGWQRQKTIPFTASKLGELQRLLCHTRTRMEAGKRTVGAAADVIDIATRGSGSPAVAPAPPSTVAEASAPVDEQVKSAIS